MDGSDYLVTLTSDQHEPQNPAAFVTHLSEPLTLNDEFEVGLWSVIYPKTWENLSDCTLTIKTNVLDDSYDLKIPGGHYSSIEQLCRLITATVKTSNPILSVPLSNFNLEYHPVQQKVFVKVPIPYRLVLDKTLSECLGLPEGEIYYKSPNLFTIGKPIYYLYGDVTKIFVYVDIIAPQRIGDKLSRLIDIIPTTRTKFGEIEKYLPRQTHYVQLSQFNISRIKIELADQTGRLIPFNGSTIVQLRFKRKVDV